MPTVFVDDSIYQDPRFVHLLYEMGSFHAALGAVVRSWIIAQRFYLKGNRMIPISEWKKMGVPSELLKVGLAEETEAGFIRVAGADQYFSYLLDRSKGGKARALNRSNQTFSPVELELTGVEQNLQKRPFLELESAGVELEKSAVTTTNKNYNKRKEVTAEFERFKPKPPIGSIEEFKGDEVLETLLADVSHAAQKAWLKAFADPAWVRQELLKCHSYRESNPRKKAKNFAIQAGKWLMRGWTWKQQEPGGQIDWEKIKQEVEKEKK